MSILSTARARSSRTGLDLITIIFLVVKSSFVLAPSFLWIHVTVHSYGHYVFNFYLNLKNPILFSSRPGLISKANCQHHDSMPLTCTLNTKDLPITDNKWLDVCDSVLVCSSTIEVNWENRTLIHFLQAHANGLCEFLGKEDKIIATMSRYF